MHATFPRAGFIRRSRRHVATPPLHAALHECSAEAQLGGLDPVAEDAAADTTDAQCASDRLLYVQGVRAGRLGGFVWGVLIGALLVAGCFKAGWVLP